MIFVIRPQDNFYSAVPMQSHCESSLSLHDEHSTVPSSCQPLDQANQLQPQARLYRQPVNSMHRHHLLLLFIPATNYHLPSHRG